MGLFSFLLKCAEERSPSYEFDSARRRQFSSRPSAVSFSADQTMSAPVDCDSILAATDQLKPFA
eukprot:scaffold22740_cov139-Cylindrotheca_fusiformis.AAC.11